jgi:hypothetical protein
MTRIVEREWREFELGQIDFYPFHIQFSFGPAPLAVQKHGRIRVIRARRFA